MLRVTNLESIDKKSGKDDMISPMSVIAVFIMATEHIVLRSACTSAAREQTRAADGTVESAAGCAPSS
jgi:hypothetical protein